MSWEVELHDSFDPEFDELPQSVQNELLAYAKLLEQFGPELGRPHVDTLKGSDFANMKELRFKADNGVWRVAFAFDSHRKAILLVSGGKQQFYRRLIRKADDRFRGHLARLKDNAAQEKKSGSKKR